MNISIRNFKIARRKMLSLRWFGFVLVSTLVRRTNHMTVIFCVHAENYLPRSSEFKALCTAPALPRATATLSNVWRGLVKQGHDHHESDATSPAPRISASQNYRSAPEPATLRRTTIPLCLSMKGDLPPLREVRCYPLL